MVKTVKPEDAAKIAAEISKRRRYARIDTRRDGGAHLANRVALEEAFTTLRDAIFRNVRQIKEAADVTLPLTCRNTNERLASVECKEYPYVSIVVTQGDSEIQVTCVASPKLHHQSLQPSKRSLKPVVQEDGGITLIETQDGQPQSIPQAADEIVRSTFGAET